MFSKKEIDYSLFGIFLGDGCVPKDGRNRLCIKHCVKQKEYMDSIYLTLEENKRRVTKPVELGNGQYWMSTYVTARHYNFNRAWKAAGPKYPSKYMLDRLTPLGLLWLWLDDGSFRVNSSNQGREGRLAMCSFTDKEVEKMMTSFTKIFNITGIRLIHQRQYPLIRFNATGMQQLIDAVIPVIQYAPPSMRYKLDLQYEGRFKYSQVLASKYNESAFPAYRYAG